MSKMTPGKNSTANFGDWPVTTVVLLLSVVPLLYNSMAAATRQDDYYNLINSLFTDYKKEVRPTNDDSSTKVYVAFWLLSIQNLDEKNQILETSLILQISWTDPWLGWDPATYSNITVFRYPQKKLWLPDVVIVNTVQSQSELGYEESPVRVSNDGLIEWYPSEIMKTSCDIDVTYYPFDTQECDIIVSTWVSTNLEIDLDLEENQTDIIKERYSPSGTWYLLSSTLSTPPDQDGVTQLKYSFRLKRLSTFYVLNMIVPVLLLSLTASAVYYLPADSGEKIGMSMTILLSYAVYLTIISDNMPQTSLQLSILSVYLTMLLGITAFSVTVSVFVLHLHHKPDDEKVGMRVKAVTRKIRTFFCMRREHEINDFDNRSNYSDNARKTSTMNTGLGDGSRFRNGKITPGVVSNDKIKINVCPSPKSLDEQEEILTWQIVAKTVDTVFFFTTSIFILLLTFIVMMVLIVGGQNAQ